MATAIAQLRGTTAQLNALSASAFNGLPNILLVEELEDGGKALRVTNGVTPGGVPVGGPTRDFNTRAAAQAALIFNNVSWLRTAGYSAPGDGGGALYKRVPVPNVPKIWHFQSADGAWWELAEFVINVRMLGAKGTANSADASTNRAAAQGAIDLLQNGTEGQGGIIRVPRGDYHVNNTLYFHQFGTVHNIRFEGEGRQCTTLLFNTAPDGTDGIHFDGGAQFELCDILISGAKRRGLVLNDVFTSYAAQFTINRVRVQSSGAAGIYSKNSYLGTLNDCWSANNGGAGFEFAGFHTSIVMSRCYASGNAAPGFSLNGFVYSSFISCASDNNEQGYVLSNMKGVGFIGCGTEANRGEGVLLVTSTAGKQNIVTEAHDIGGVFFKGCNNLGNGTNNPATIATGFAAIANDPGTIRFSIEDCADNSQGQPSVNLVGTNGLIVLREAMNVFGGAVSASGNVQWYAGLVNSLLGAKSVVGRSTPQAINTGVVTVLPFDQATSNGLNAWAGSGDRLTVPANKGIKRVRLSFNVAFAASATGERRVTVLKNGNHMAELPDVIYKAGGIACFVGGSSGELDVAAGDYFQLRVFQNSGGALNVEASTSTWFKMEVSG